MNESYKIGILIPAYNVENYIFRAMDSCIKQTYKNIEIIVVDDGSKDNTYEVVRGYAEKDSRIKLYRKENGGVSSARNMALDMCQSDYVMFLDSDDWLELDAVEKLVQQIVLCSTERVIVSANCYYAYPEENGIRKIIAPNYNEEAAMSAEDALMYVGGANFILRNAGFKLYSVSVLNERNLRFSTDIHHGEDGLFVFEYLKNADKFIYIPTPLWNLLERPGSVTKVPHNPSKNTAITAVERMLKYDNSKALHDELEKFYVRRILSVLAGAFVSTPLPIDDIKYMRKLLRSQFWMYMRKQKDTKQIVLYLLETFVPKPLATAFFKTKIKT